MKKVFRLKGGSLLGFCGVMHECMMVKEWLDDGGDKPKVSDTFHAILIRDRKLHVIEDSLIVVPYERPTFAVGSGRDFAMAAMHLGKSAREAVEIAALFDVNTGGPIVEVSVDG